MRGANFMHVKNQKAYIKREKAQSILTLFMKLYFWKKIMADLLLNSLEPGGRGGGGSWHAYMGDIKGIKLINL